MNLTKRLLTTSFNKLTTSFHPNTPLHLLKPILVPNTPLLFYSTSPSYPIPITPQQTLNLITSQTWSETLQTTLKKSNFDFCHENIIYVLKKLSKDQPKKVGHFFTWVVGEKENGFKPSSAVYSLLLKVYANKEKINEFWKVVHKMKEEGFFIDDQDYFLILREFKDLGMVKECAVFTKFYNAMGKDNVVKEVVKDFLNEAEWGNVVEEKLNGVKFGDEMTDNFVLRVLKGLRKEPLKGLAFFRFVSEKYGFEHSSVTHNGMLRVLGHEETVKEFWSVFEEMKSAGFEMDLDTYLKVTRFFQKRKMLKEAVELYERMMDSPYKPSVQDCSVLLRTLAGNSAPDLELVFRVVDKFKETGNTLSKSVYDGIHRSLTSVGQFDEAEKIMVAIKDAGYELDNITYSQLIFGLCKARRLEEAAKVIDLMEEKGCIPDVKTWTILIQGHCSANELDKAVMFLANMVEKGCEADADLLDVLINGFLSENSTIGAYEILKEMVKTGGVKPWQATYKNMIQHLIVERKVDESLELLRLMKKHDYPPFSEPFVSYISKYGTVDDALEYLKVITFKESPPVSAYQTMFQSLCNEGRELEAKDLLFKCPPHVRKHKAISSLFGSVQSSVV